MQRNETTNFVKGEMSTSLVIGIVQEC